MDTSKEIIKRWFYPVVDIISVLFSWFFAYQIRFYGPFSIEKGIPEWKAYLKLLPFIVIIWFVTFSLRGFYKKEKKFRSALVENFEVLKASLFAIIIFVAVTYFYDEYRYSRLTLLIFAIIHPLLIMGARSLLHKFLRLYSKNYKARKILVIGGGEHLAKSLDFADTMNFSSIRLVGVMGIGDEHQVEQAKNLAVSWQCPFFTVPDDWAKFFLQTPCETVIIAPPFTCHDFLKTYLEPLANQVSDIKLLPDLSYLTKFSSKVELVMNMPIINIHDSPLKGMGHIQKRVFDILGSIACLIIFSPIMFICAFLVRLSSPGNIFYKQDRMGLDGNIFTILKFRTMPLDAEKKSGAIWASKNDGRSTNIGKFLRKTSLDELPQLINVLRGEMSLVGPRPERPIFVDQFRRSIPGYMLRHKVKAGMTGMAQVSGWRGNTSIEKRIECDLFYIQNWSLWLDIKILFLTLFKGFINPNAY